MSVLLKGEKLLKMQGGEFKEVDAEEHLKGKVVALYFSAHWCPPCRQFTPVLKDFYNEVVANDEPFEIVFVSCDRTEEDQQSYMKGSHGDWCVVKFGDPLAQKLQEDYGVTGIPALVVVKADGKAVRSNARADVQAKGPGIFGSWKSEALAA